jgi:4-hydroxy-tetrahydrodipicolinate synthase
MIAVLEKSAGVRYVKESSGVFDNFQQILVSTGLRVKVFMGEEALSLEALLMGAAGLIMGLANAIPDRFVAMLKAVRSGDIAQARQLHYQTLPLYNLANEGATHNYNSVIKSVIKLRRGKRVTSSRAPSLPLTDPQEGKLAELLDRIGLGSAK